ncbi:adhesin Lsa14 [Leptospira licerasiae]|uniref:adhesin Lsa14 n=1 Tax=Leptospira licerasiae TaxID=447106 RepID=UPI001082AD09|nr:TRL-like family protein [Leptospira licerasiae]TGM85564.1 TRL-like family protein [Leptospira licerasiae]
MKIKSFVLGCMLLVSFIGCTGMNVGIIAGTTPNTNPTKNYGLYYPIQVKGGYFVHSGEIPGQIGFGAEMTSTGKACSRSVLGIVAWGDSSIAAAKADGKITKLASTDYEQFAVLQGLYHSFCTIATGSSTSIGQETAPAAVKKK